MTEPFPLQPLLDLANSRMDDAARKLGELIASEQACEEKLRMLLQYRSEYRERFVAAARDGIDQNGWRNYSAFLLKLDDAITHQQKIVDHSKTATSVGQQHWVSERNRAKAFDTLSLRQQQQQHRREAKQEQHASDEHSAKQHQQQKDE